MLLLSSSLINTRELIKKEVQWNPLIQALMGQKKV